MFEFKSHHGFESINHEEKNHFGFKIFKGNAIHLMDEIHDQFISSKLGSCINSSGNHKRPFNI
jgi:hypothetical protein